MRLELEGGGQVLAPLEPYQRSLMLDFTLQIFLMRGSAREHQMLTLLCNRCWHSERSVINLSQGSDTKMHWGVEKDIRLVGGYHHPWVLLSFFHLYAF